MDIFGTGSKIEEIESDVEETTEHLQEVQKRENLLQDAVEKLQHDIETSDILREKKVEKTEEKKELLERIDEYKAKVQELESQINEAITANEDSKSILRSLELLGEEVQEGLDILADRQQMIEKCKEQLAEVMEKLNMATSFSESSSETGSEPVSKVGERKARNAFVESLRVDPSGQGQDKSVLSSSSSSEDTDVKGQREKERAHTTAKDRDDGIFSTISASQEGKSKQLVSDEAKDTGEIRNQILACDHDPCIDRFGWKAKQREFSLEEDLREVNPGFYTNNERKTKNCQRCVIAFEARLRGADVRATDRILDGTDTLPFMRNPNGWPSCFKDPVIVPCIGSTGIDTKERVIEEMKKGGNGSRAIVRIQIHDTISVRDQNGEKKTFIVDRSNGTVVVKDQKTRRLVDPSSIFPNHDLSNGLITREVKNPFNPRVKEIQLISRKSGEPIAIVKGGGGHVFTAMQMDGETVFCEPQRGVIIKDPDTYFVNAKPYETHVMRIDNLEFTERAKDCCQSV